MGKATCPPTRHRCHPQPRGAMVTPAAALRSPHQHDKGFASHRPGLAAPPRPRPLRHRRCQSGAMCRYQLAIFLIICGLMACPIPAAAAVGFMIDGRPVEPQDINFAGVRHASPKYRIAVQINHDTQTPAQLELTVVDEVFQALLAKHRREPYIPAEALPVVFITDDKLRRFSEGPRRLLFGPLETAIKQQREVYPAPTAIFITDAALADGHRLRAGLQLGLGYLFQEDFYQAIVGLERAIPRPAE